MEREYKIKNYMDNLYEVYDDDLTQYFVGSISDCLAWIECVKRGYINEGT